MQKLSELISHILQTHHVFTRESLNRIQGIINSPAMQGQVVSADIRQCIEALEEDLLPHLMKEEQILFPYIVKLEGNPRQNYAPDFGSIANPIRVMGNEHKSVIKLLVRLRELTSDYQIVTEDQSGLSPLFSILGELDRDLVTHIQLESIDL